MENTQQATINSEALLESRSLRDSYADQAEALEKVGKLTMLPDDLHVTVEMTADFYNVDKKIVEKNIERHWDEIESDGLKILDGEELRKFKRGLRHNVGKLRFAPSITLLPRRAVLRIGMLLRDSEVAKALRSYLLNVEEIARKEAPEIVGEALESMIKVHNLPRDYEEALDHLLKQVRANKQLISEVKAVKAEAETMKAENAVMAPKARRFDRFLNADNLMRIEDVSKAFGIKGMGRNNFFKYLRDKGLLVKSRFGNRSLPLQRFINAGLFEVVWKTFDKYDPATGTSISIESPMTYVTAKGVDYIYKLMEQDGLLAA